MEEGDILAPSKEACRIASIRKAIFESTKDKHG
jgi:hypothetical protein